MFLIIVTILALVAQILLTLIVLVKDTKSLRNRAFALLSFALLLWAMVNFVSETFPDAAKNIYIIRSIIFFAALQNCFFVFFSFSLTGKQLKMTKKVLTYLLLSIVTCALTLSPLIFYELVPTGHGGLYPSVLPGMAVFVLHAAMSVFLGFRFLLRQLRRSSGARHQQMLYILFGSVVLWGIVPLTNFVMSLALQTSFFANLSPLYAFAFSALIAVAIIRHKLFDIRPAIARAVAYLLLLFTFATVYALSVFGTIRLLFGDNGRVDLAQNIIYVVAALFLAITFEPLRIFFSKLTNKIFFQDMYETQSILDRINSILVRSVSVDQLTHRSLVVLNGALKARYAAVVILARKENQSDRIVSADGENVPNFGEITKELAHHPRLSYILDEIGNQSNPVYELMNKVDAAVVVRLETSKELVGYVLFGHKESGYAYSRQDVDLIRIASGELAVAIQNTLRFEEIAHFNETLQGEVHDATAELRHTNKKLHLLDEAKDDFISMASHQLRTPLTSVKGYISMVLDGDMGKITDDQRKVLEEAFASSQRMVYLISDFLNVSRLQTGKFELERSRTNLAEILTDEIDQLQAMASGRQITIEYTSPSHFPVINIDQDKFRQVMMNFIDNAIYYSNSNTTITVQLYTEAEDVIFKVIDQGIGVPSDERHKLFTKFYRATNARKQRPDGTGIGLFMAQKVIVAHGGSVIFESKEGKGSTFGFRLPMKLAELKDDSKKLEK